MDRARYILNKDYSDGYDEGVKDGREQMKKQIKYASEEIKKILNIFQDTEYRKEDIQSKQTDEEIKLGDEVVSDYGGIKGVVVGIDTYKDEVMLSLLMRNHKVPQLVKASMYKTKTDRHFPQIIEVLEQIKGEADEK